MVGSRSARVFLTAALLAGCGENAFEPSGGTEEFDWSDTVAAGRTLEIKGISGNIDAVSTPGTRVEVHAVKRGSRNDPADVTIDVVQHAGGVTICAVYPDVPGEPRNRCQPGDAGHLGARDNDVQVDFEVSIPAGVDLRVLAVSGNIEAIGMENDVFATTVSGNIDITTTGVAEAATVSGSIDVEIGEADWDQGLAFTGVSGNVTVRVPSNTNAFVTATTVSGTVTSDFPLSGTARSRSGGIGASGPPLYLTTVSGNVRLRSGPAA